MMTTTNEVKLPELPLEGVKVQSPVDGTMHKAGFTANQMQTYAKQYGTLCYEAGLAAGRVQTGEQEDNISPAVEKAMGRFYKKLAEGETAKAVKTREREEKIKEILSGLELREVHESEGKTWIPEAKHWDYKKAIGEIRRLMEGAQ